MEINNHDTQITSLSNLQWYDITIPVGTTARVKDADFIEFEYPDGKKEVRAAADYHRPGYWNGYDVGTIRFCYPMQIINFIRNGNEYHARGEVNPVAIIGVRRNQLKNKI